MLGTYAQESRADEERTSFFISDCASTHPQMAQGSSPAVDALMAALEARDDETNGHAERVVSFSHRLGCELGLSRREMAALELGARLHDIGKIAVPDSILHKPAELDTEEWQKMREHPARGATIVRNLRLPEGVALVVGQHHEKWDGTGYPSHLAGEEIFLPARVFSVIDAFDAITSDRIYRTGAPYEEALRRIIAASGTQFDPQVVAAFTRVPAFDWELIRIVCANESEAKSTQSSY
jgi:putative nucleotidyltransferase with HDIG domain